MIYDNNKESKKNVLNGKDGMEMWNLWKELWKCCIPLRFQRYQNRNLIPSQISIEIQNGSESKKQMEWKELLRQYEKKKKNEKKRKESLKKCTISKFKLYIHDYRRFFFF